MRKIILAASALALTAPAFTAPAMAHRTGYAHSHRAGIERDAAGRLFVNPGETSGWTYRRPSIALLETSPLDARLVFLPEPPPIPQEFVDS